MGSLQLQMSTWAVFCRLSFQLLMLICNCKEQLSFFSSSSHPWVKCLKQASCLACKGAYYCQSQEEGGVSSLIEVHHITIVSNWFDWTTPMSSNMLNGFSSEVRLESWLVTNNQLGDFEFKKHLANNLFLNRPYLYSWNCSGTSLQWRLMLGKIMGGGGVL